MSDKVGQERPYLCGGMSDGAAKIAGASRRASNRSQPAGNKPNTASVLHASRAHQNNGNAGPSNGPSRNQIMSQGATQQYHANDRNGRVNVNEFLSKYT